MELDLIGSNFTVSDKLLNYRNARIYFEEQYIQILDEFYNDFDKYTSIENLINEIRSDFRQHINKLFKVCVKICADEGIYNIDTQSLYEICDKQGDFEAFYNICNSLLSKYAQLENQEAQRQQMKQLQRQNRSSWSGGGFGLQGALKGAATAGALNAGTGLFRAVGDGISDSSARKKHEAKKKNILTSDSTINNLYYGLEVSMKNVFDTLIYYVLVEYGIDKYAYEFKYREAEVIMNNINDDVIPKDKIEESLYLVLYYNPFATRPYVYLLEHFTQYSNNIIYMANFFNVNISNEISSLLNRYYNSLPVKTLENLQESKLKLNSFCTKINVEKEFQTLVELNEKFDSDIYNEQYKLFEKYFNTLPLNSLNDTEDSIGLVNKYYDDNNLNMPNEREKFIKQIIDKEFQLKINVLNDAYNRLDKDSEEKCIQSRAVLIEICDKIDIVHDNEVIWKIEALIKSFNEQKRTLDGVVYESVEVKEQKSNAKHEVVSIIDNHSLNSTESIKQCISDLNNVNDAIAYKYINFLKVKENYLNILDNLDSYCVPKQLKKDISMAGKFVPLDENNLNDDLIFKIDKINKHLDYLKSNEYKERYELAYAYSENKNTSFFMKLFIYPLSFLLLFFILNFLLSFILGGFAFYVAGGLSFIGIIGSINDEKKGKPIYQKEFKAKGIKQLPKYE